LDSDRFFIVHCVYFDSFFFPLQLYNSIVLFGDDLQPRGKLEGETNC